MANEAVLDRLFSSRTWFSLIISGPPMFHTRTSFIHYRLYSILATGSVCLTQQSTTGTYPEPNESSPHPYRLVV